MLHVGPAGQLTDSLVQPPAPLPGSSTGSGPNSTQGSSQTSGSSQTATTSQSSNSSQPADPNNPNDPNAQAPDPLNMALRRPSDRIIGGGRAELPGAAPTSAQPWGPMDSPLQRRNRIPISPSNPRSRFQASPCNSRGSESAGDAARSLTTSDPGPAAVPGQPVTPQDPSQPPQPRRR